MALNKRDRIGIIVLVGLFCLFALLLFLTVERPSNPARGFEDNVIIQQRMKALQDRQSSY